MTRAVLTWRDGEHIHWAELAEGRASLIGRAPGCTIAIGPEHETVSRAHALVSNPNGHYVLEHRSQSRPTLVNDRVIDGTRPVDLTDGDGIMLGTLRLTFHDLAAGDRPFGWVCSTCSHQNPATNAACWFDGTSRAHADSQPRVWQPVVCRAILYRDEQPEGYDLRLGDVLAVTRTAVRMAREDDLPLGTLVVADMRERRPRFQLLAPRSRILVNGVALTDGRVIETGDELSTAGLRLLFVVR
jgi:hypothetical protein